MPTYILQPGNHVIHYPESCVTEPADLASFLGEMEPSFRHLLSKVEPGRSTDIVIEAFGRSLLGSSPQYKVPYWQTYRFGPGKWPYGKWALDKLRWFIADPAKLLHALAELERAKECQAAILHSSRMQTLEIKLLGEPDQPDSFISELELS
jgi:hypothetical protein